MEIEILSLPRTDNLKLQALGITVFFWVMAALSWATFVFAQEVVESQGIRFRFIPGGSYFLGSSLNEAGRYANEPTPYQVTLKAFYLAESETTNAQYDLFLVATRHSPPLYWQDKNLNAPNQPVVGVTWNDAQDYCRWLTQTTGIVHRLPTEAEWEAAARGGLTNESFPWGQDLPDAGGRYRANYYTKAFVDNSFRFSTPVGSFPPNGYGLFDMAGNVSEWCADKKSPPGLPTPFAEPDYRILKGGSWWSRARDLRVAARQFAPPASADGFIGFRALREISTTP